MAREEWDQHDNRIVGLFLNGQGFVHPDAHGEELRDDSYLLLFNGHHEDVTFTLPAARFGARWALELSTADPSAQPEAWSAAAGSARHDGPLRHRAAGGRTGVSSVPGAPRATGRTGQRAESVGSFASRHRVDPFTRRQDKLRVVPTAGPAKPSGNLVTTVTAHGEPSGSSRANATTCPATAPSASNAWYPDPTANAAGSRLRTASAWRITHILDEPSSSAARSTPKSTADAASDAKTPAAGGSPRAGDCRGRPG